MQMLAVSQTIPAGQACWLRPPQSPASCWWSRLPTLNGTDPCRPQKIMGMLKCDL